MIQNLQDTVTLNNGVKIPGMGLGVFQIPDADTAAIVEAGIKAGYRLIDTAAVYGNEAGTGEGIRRGLAATGLKREDLFVTTKVWNDGLNGEQTKVAFEESLTKLGLDYLDLYLIHWPGKDANFKDVWLAMEDLYKAGKIRALGVSNFEPHHLEALLSYATVKPVINQVETHPRNSQTAVREFNAAHDILTQAWSPLAQGTLFDNPTLQQIAAAHHKSVAQVIFRWDLQHDILLLTKSAKASRLVDNAAIFDFTLSDDEMAQIDALNQDHRVGPHPDEYNFEL